MNVISLLLFLLGVVAAGVLAVGMTTYPCGVPLLILAAAMCLGAWKKSSQTGKAGPTVWFIAMVAGYFAWRMWQSPISDFARNDAFLLAGAVIGFWWAAFNGHAASFPRLLLGLWFLHLANVGVAIWQEFGGADVYTLVGERMAKIYPSGLYYHYNHFSNFVLGIGLLSLGYGLSGQMKWPMRVASLLMYALAVYGIYLAHSRGAWLGLGVGTALAFVGWLLNLHRTKTSWAGIVLVSSAVLAPLLVIGAWRMGTSAVAFRGFGDSGRMGYSGIAVDLIPDHPWIGGGSRSYYFNSIEKWNPQEMDPGGNDIQYVHNEYLQAAVDYGLVGAALLLVLMGLVFFRGVAMLLMGDAKSPGDRGVAVGSMASLAAMGTQAFFSFVFHVLPDVILMGFCIGCLVRQPWVLSEYSLRELKKREVIRLHWGYGLTGALLGLSVMALAMRDAAAWMTMYPRMDHNEKNLLIRAERLQRALEIRPDFYFYGKCASLLSEARVTEDLTAEQKTALTKQAVGLLEKAVERAPQSYADWIHLAMLYDLLGEYEKAEAIYVRHKDILAAREVHYGANYLYARNISFRAQAAWRQRNPAQALTLFLQAKKELDASSKLWFRSSDPSLRQVIEKSIKFLEGAGIKPE
jgi:O-antigen ligase